MTVLSVTNHEVFEALKENLVGGVNSPVRAFKAMNTAPIVIEKGKGDLLFDVEGKEYIDFCMSWGALILGHADERVIEPAIERMKKGTSFGISTEIEGKLAFLVKKLVPSMEKVRFVSSGTEATMTAVRLARGYTSKEYILKFSGHYHGHADSFLVEAGSGVALLNGTSSSKGIPLAFTEKTICIPFNNEALLTSFFEDSFYKDKIAAVILEPVAGNMGLVPANPSFMKLLREITEKKGTLLIFDEVMTGFRVAKECAQGMYDIQPDMTCLGKIVGGGFPAAAFGGKREIMDFLAPLGPVYQAGTLSGNPIAMEAGFQTLSLLQEEGFYEALLEKREFLLEEIEKTIKEKSLPCVVQKCGAMFSLFFGVEKVTSFEEAKQNNTALFALFFKYMLDNGVYIPPSSFEAWFISESHTSPHLQKTRELILNFFKVHYADFY